MREEIQSLYLEVYKQQRLPGSPPGELELMEEVVSSFKDCPGWKEEKTLGATVRSQPANAQPMRSRTLEKERRESSVKQSLATVREAHQKVLAAAAALEGEIERLSHPTPIASQR